VSRSTITRLFFWKSAAFESTCVSITVPLTRFLSLDAAVSRA
jgi:hypothetical protein